jgi:restriction system protein
MAIPDYQSCFLSLLKSLADGKNHSFRETVEALAKEFKLIEHKKKDFKFVTQTMFYDRIQLHFS